jgi:hypothetical protein
MASALAELLARAPREDLVVDERQSLLFDPNLPRFAPSVHRVKISGFGDLRGRATL